MSDTNWEAACKNESRRASTYQRRWIVAQSQIQELKDLNLQAAEKMSELIMDNNQLRNRRD